jgi:hypothetical protein
MADSGVAAYFAGGMPGAFPTGVTTVDKFAFPSDTRSTLGTGLSSTTIEASGWANSGTAGYIGGGTRVGSPSADVDKFAFPADTRTTLATGLSVGTRLGGAFANEGTF